MYKLDRSCTEMTRSPSGTRSQRWVPPGLQKNTEVCAIASWTSQEYYSFYYSSLWTCEVLNVNQRKHGDQSGCSPQLDDKGADSWNDNSTRELCMWWVRMRNGIRKGLMVMKLSFFSETEWPRACSPHRWKGMRYATPLFKSFGHEKLEKWWKISCINLSRHTTTTVLKVTVANSSHPNWCHLYSSELK